MKEKRSFDDKYKKAVSKRVSEGKLMRKKLPTHIRSGIGELAKSEREYAVSVDFELEDDEPERMIVNHGSETSVERDIDMELNIHTHPTLNEKNPSLFGVPSPGDLGNVTLERPSIIAWLDERKNVKFTLIRSIHEPLDTDDHYTKTRAKFDKIWDAELKRLKKEKILPFKKSSDSRAFFARFKKILNDHGFDMKVTTLDSHVYMRNDDNDERVVSMKRRGYVKKNFIRVIRGHATSSGITEYDVTATSDGIVVLIGKGVSKRVLNVFLSFIDKNSPGKVDITAGREGTRVDIRVRD